MPPKITHVAIRFQGVVYSLPAPNRHHDVIYDTAAKTGAKFIDSLGDDQGFLDEAGEYLTRQQAYIRAHETRQIKPNLPYDLDELFSEDIW